MMRNSLYGRPFSAPAGTPPDPHFVDSMTSASANQYEHQLEVIRREIERNPGFQDSVALQTRWRAGISAYNMEAKLDERSRLMSLRTNAWREIQDFIYYYRTHFEAAVEREQDNSDFYYGYQWDDQEIRRLQKILMVPHVSNYMTRWARTLIGEKRGSETQFVFESEDSTKALLCDFYNQVCGKLSRINEWNHKSADVFSNLAILGRCFTSVRPDPYDPFAKVLMQNERPQEFLYDFEHAKDGTLDGCNYLMRTYYKDLEEVIFQFPEWEDYLLNYDYAAASGIEQLLLFTIARPKVPPTAFKRAVEVPQQFIQRPFFQRRRLAWITEFHRKEGLIQWTVRDGNFNIEYDFDAPDQAAFFYRNLRDASIARNIATTGQAGLDLVYEPRRMVRRVLTSETWCSNVLLDVKTTRVDRFPYVAMHNEFYQGQWRGYFEDDKPNQKMRNKMLVLIDMAIGGLKGKSFYHESLFSPGSTEKQRQEMLRDPMTAMIGKWDKNMDTRNLHFTVQPSGVDGPMLREMIAQARDASNFVNGGLNSVGDAEFAGQSDRMRRGLQGSAQTGTVGIMEDMRRAECRIGQHLVYTAQNLHPTVLLEYANSEDRERFMPLLKSMAHSVEMDQITMNVNEVLSGPTRSDRQKADLLEIVGQDPTMLHSVMPEIMRLDKFPQSMVERIEQRTQDAQQAAQEAQSQEAQTEAQVQQHKMMIAEGKLAVEQGHLEVAKHPPVALAYSGKVNAPGPDAMASMFNQHGIAADPKHIADSERAQDEKDQARDNRRQKNFNRLDLPYQRSLAKLHPTEKKPKAAGGAKGAGVRSPKDRNNRQRKKAERVETQV